LRKRSHNLLEAEETIMVYDKLIKGNENQLK
jgi:hypothetical protein